MTREEKVSSFVTPRNLEVHEHVVFIFMEQTRCVKIMQSQSELLCKAIHARLICPEFIILLRSFPSDISLWLWLCVLSPLSGLFSSTRGVFGTSHVSRTLEISSLNFKLNFDRWFERKIWILKWSPPIQNFISRQISEICIHQKKIIGKSRIEINNILDIPVSMPT